MRFRSFVPCLLVASPIAVSAFGCYAATEVTVVLSTDLTCDGTLDTLVYKGAPSSLDATPNAETKGCTLSTQSGSDNDIGTLTFTPSGDKNGEVSVKAVLARNGKDPSRCAADATDCIIATRKFTFVEHSSQRIPIRLLEDCVGTVCPAGETCVGPGKCSADNVSCVDPGKCPDAGTDAGGHGGAVAATCSKRGTGHDGVLATATSIPGAQLSALVREQPGYPAAISWYADAFVYRVAVDGLSDVTPVKATTLVAVTDARDGSLGSVGFGQSGATYVYRGTEQNRQPLIKDPISIAARSDVAIVGAKKDVWLVKTGGGAAPLGAYDGSRVAVTVAAAYAASSDGVHVFALDGMPLPGGGAIPLSAMASVPVAFAVNASGRNAFAAGLTPRGVVIANLNDPSPVPNAFKPSGPRTDEPIVSLAADDARLYFTHGGDGILTAGGGKGQSRLYPTDPVALPPAAVDHLAVDDTCMYFWESSSGKAVLRAIEKP